MLAPAELYPAVVLWLQGLGAFGHAAGLASVADVVTAVLIGQSLRVGGLARALLSASEVAARHRYRRLRRVVTGARLRSTDLTPFLVRAALALVEDAEPHLAMDTVRCGPWEVITIGVVWHGRVLLVGWEVVPYPWPVASSRRRCSGCSGGSRRPGRPSGVRIWSPTAGSRA